MSFETVSILALLHYAHLSLFAGAQGKYLIYRRAIRKNGAGGGEALFLPAGEADAVLADLGVVALGQFLDHVVDLGDSRGLHDVGEAGVGLVAMRFS